MDARAVAFVAVLALSGAPGALVPRAFSDAASDAMAAEAQKAAVALVERMKSSDSEVKKKGMEEALKVQHPLVTSALARALSDADEPIRRAALLALVARTDEIGKKAAAAAIAARLERIAKKDDATSERMLVIQALHDLAQPSTLRALADELGPDVSADELSARLTAIANIPSKDAIEQIIAFRASGRRRGGAIEPEGPNRGGIARRAFQDAVGIDVGQDPDAMRAWWKDHEKGFDFQAAAERRQREGSAARGKPASPQKPGDEKKKPEDGTTPTPTPK